MKQIQIQALHIPQALSGDTCMCELLSQHNKPLKYEQVIVEFSSSTTFQNLP